MEVMVWAGIALGGRADRHIFPGATVRYRDVILDQHVRPFFVTMSRDDTLMDDNA